MERVLCRIFGFAEILTSFWSKLYKVNTSLLRTHQVNPAGVRCKQVPLYYKNTVTLIQITKFTSTRPYIHIIVIYGDSVKIYNAGR